MAGREEHVARGLRAARCDGSRSEHEGGDDYCRSEQSAMANAAAPRRPPIFSAVPGRRRQRRRRMPVTAYPFLQPCMKPLGRISYKPRLALSGAAVRRRILPRRLAALRILVRSTGAASRSPQHRRTRCYWQRGTPLRLLASRGRKPNATGNFFFTSRLFSPPDPAVGWSPSDASVMRPGTPCGDGTAETGDWRGTAPGKPHRCGRA